MKFLIFVFFWSLIDLSISVPITTNQVFYGENGNISPIAAASGNFNYDTNDDVLGPLNWGSKFHKDCNGLRQSPVNIDTSNQNCAQTFGPLAISKFSTKPASVRVVNDGHSFAMAFNYADGKPAQFSGGPLKVPYNIVNLHFHWGDTDEFGSEHTFNGKQYAAEGHFVSYNSNYGSLADAVKQPDGLAVLGVFYQLTYSTTRNPFVNLIQKVVQPATSFTETVNAFSIQDLIATDKIKIYSYPGSLTTPECSESVTWMVSYLPMRISPSDLNELRSLIDNSGNYISKNFRPLQNLNNRKFTSN